MKVETTEDKRTRCCFVLAETDREHKTDVSAEEGRTGDLMEGASRPVSRLFPAPTF